METHTQFQRKLRKKSHDDKVELEENGMYLNIPIPDGLLASYDQEIHDTTGDVSNIIFNI